MLHLLKKGSLRQTRDGSHRKEKALDYEAYLKQLEDLIQRVVKGIADNMPAVIDTPAKRALYNNLGGDEALALKVDAKVKAVRPDDRRGVETKERVIKQALFNILGDEATVERLFPIIKAQGEY